MKTFDFVLLNQGYAMHNGDWNFGPICSSFTRIYWVRDGEAVVRMGMKDYRLTPGHMYLIPPLVSHYDECDGRFGHVYIHFMDRSKNVIDYYHNYNLPFELELTNDDRYIFQRLMHLYPNKNLTNPLPETYETSSKLLDATKTFHSQPLGLRMEVNGLLLQLLSRFFTNGTRKHKINDDRISQTLYTIERNLSNTPDVGKLASDVHLGKDRFIRLFSQQTGSTPTNYIIRMRIQQAQMLFIDGNSSVKEVASILGYDNISYFGRLFKKVTEMTPSEFIRQNK